MIRFLELGLIWGILFAVAATNGCEDRTARTSRDTLAAAQGYLVSAQSKHTMECIQTQGKLPVCDLLTRASYAQNAAVSALEVYCQLPPHTNTEPNRRCAPVASAKDALLGAIGNLNQILPDLRGAAQ